MIFRTWCSKWFGGGGPWRSGVLAALLSAACGTPDDIIVDLPAIGPVEVAPGVFRLTFNPGPDQVRGFNRAGDRIIYRSQGLVGFEDDWLLLEVPVDGGTAREVAGLYREALSENVGHLTFAGPRRVLVGWRPMFPGGPGCPAPCPAVPIVWGINVVLLDSLDGPALSQLPSRVIALPLVTGGFGGSPMLRRSPAALELSEGGANPFGPVTLPGDSLAIISDGETLWRISLGMPSAPADSLGPGAFPSLSPDGSLLAASTPVGVTATTEVCSVIRGLGVCTQQTITQRPAGWNTLLYDLSADSSYVLTTGVGARFDPTDGQRVLVRRPDGLYRVDRGSGDATLVAGTADARGFAISPDGLVIAFSMVVEGNEDVYFVRQ